MTSTYVIRGGIEGRERLRILARVMWPGTSALFTRVGIPATAHCLDVGCGGGDVTLALARLAAEGTALGVDVDAVQVDLAREEAVAAGITNAEFRVGDVLDAEVELGEPPFDVVYVRFLLTHLPDPAAALSALAATVAPGGVIIVEDCDFSGHVGHPESAAFRRYVELYSEVVRWRGCDPDIGPRLPQLLRDAGFAGVEASIVQPAGVTGEVKLIAPITLEAIGASVVDAGLCTPDELRALVDELMTFATTDGTFLSAARVVQAWARAPA